MVTHWVPLEQRGWHAEDSPDCFCEPVVYVDVGERVNWVHQKVEWDFGLRLAWSRMLMANEWLKDLAYK